MKPNWKDAPTWATHWLEIEGNRELWSDKEYTNGIEIGWVDADAVLANHEIEDAKSFFMLHVIQCIPRPQWKTLIHFKDSGKLVTYEADGQLTHSAVKRQLMGELGVDSGFRFVLEYKKLN